ncbi:hypothetical protein SAY87_015617 [Trapa incisa]|uniref:Uncharacterized protein n=1 Tax=Trapa incisa TaxID=236973 RepID=A0AAN7LF35_9MYRT|nr:hypothetical protein SAY87_015617 [Trapa incisa]
MAKLRNNGMGKKPIGIVKLKTAVEKLQKIILLLGKKQQSYDAFRDCHNDVPEDVKEGHFAVDGEHLKRFVVPLSCLTHPGFVKLLEQAAEEYGFNHGGALAVPCRPSELERILAEGREPGHGGYEDDGTNWGLLL